jgi:hypothetical protein
MEETQLSTPAPHVQILVGREAAAPTPSAAASPSVVAQPAAAAAATAATCSSSHLAAQTLQASPAGVGLFGKLADVEVQLVMQHLDGLSMLRFARCSRALFRCSSHPFGWQQVTLGVDVSGSEVIEDPRRAPSLLRFASSIAYVDQHASDPSSLASCATLLRVPQLVALQFQTASQSLMQQSEWHAFLQHPNAQRLEDVSLWLQPALCDAASVTLLSQLPLLNTLSLQLPAVVSAAHLLPLVNCPSLAVIDVLGPTDGSSMLPAPLEPLTRCTRLRKLTLQQLNLRAGQLSELLIQLAQAGGQLQQLRLINLCMLPMDDSVVAAAAAAEPAEDMLNFELILAAPFLLHLSKLAVCATAVGLDCVPCIPSLRQLQLELRLLPSVTKLELLLRRLPNVRCAIDVFQPREAVKLLQLNQLAQQCTRFSVKEIT